MAIDLPGIARLQSFGKNLLDIHNLRRYPDSDREETGEECMTLCIAAECRYEGTPCIAMICDTRAERGGVFQELVGSEDAEKVREIGPITALLSGDATGADDKAGDDQEASTYMVNEKPKMGFTIKNHKSREIPISDDLVEALKMYQVLYPNRPTIFVNREGGPEGHFLGKLKDIVKRAGLPGEWSLHKFRRTFATNALANGVPIHVVQEWLGHCDLTTLKRYAAKIEMKKPQYRNYANRVAQAVKV